MTRLTVSSDRLSDGREILYFDEGLAPERPHDRRGLAPARTSPTLRYDRLLGEWVTVAGHRQDRTFLPPDEDWPLCPSRQGRLTEIPASDYDVVVFENFGREIGVTLGHPHGQIYGYPFVTPRTERMLGQARRHREQTGRSLFADVLAAELASGDRVVARGERWSAFVPFAARWPVEVHLYPHRRVAALPELDEAERSELPDLYLALLRRMEAAYGAAMPYISAWHQAPVRRDRDLAHLHLELFSIRRAPGKLKYLAGSESAMGAFVSDRAPEETARALREAEA